MAFQRTAEQEAIVDASVRGESFAVTAFAGAGKTSTLIEIAKENPGKRILYLAFNKSIATEAQEKFAGADALNVEVRTAHSIAYGSLPRSERSRLTTGTWELKMALKPRLAADIAQIAVAEHGREKRRDAEYLYGVVSTLTRFMNSAEQRIDDRHVPSHYRDPEHAFNVDAIVEMASDAWGEMARDGGNLPILHDTYLKTWQLGRPRLKHDLILFDECQDASPVMLSIVEQQKTAQKIYVGDPHQAIYAWRGAMNAIESLDLPMYPLSQSWRFGQVIADQANRILETKGETRPIIGAPLREGEEPGRIVVGGVEPNVVLARTNVGLVGEALAQIEAGRSVGVVGGVDEVARKMIGAYELMTTNTTKVGFYKGFDDYEELLAASETDEGAQFKPFIRMLDIYGEQVPLIAASLRVNCVDVAKADVTLCTAHKFKGSEADIVRLGDDFREFCKVDDRTGKVEYDTAEANLVYVAVTRARKVLDLGGFAEKLESSIALANDLRAELDLGAGAAITDRPPSESLEERFASAIKASGKASLAMMPVEGHRVTGTLLFAEGEPGVGGFVVVDHGRNVAAIGTSVAVARTLHDQVGTTITLQAGVGERGRPEWRSVDIDRGGENEVEISR